jgi:3'-phosphoadenosine 5'-phosphosulfate (PAPS) 3'-phosphatase
MDSLMSSNWACRKENEVVLVSSLYWSWERELKTANYNSNKSKQQILTNKHETNKHETNKHETNKHETNKSIQNIPIISFRLLGSSFLKTEYL